MPGRTQPDCAIRDFRTLYRDHHGFVWYSLHRFGTATEAVEDALQDVFVIAYRRRSTFDGSSTKGWLYGIARRVASNYRRSLRRRRERVRALGACQPRPMSDGAREAIETLDRYVAGLAPMDRELFVLAEVEGMTGPEIAEACGLNLQTAYTRIRKLRLGCRAELSNVAEVKRARPQASARSWATLAPLLGGPQLATATGWTAALGSTWLAAGLSAAVASGALLIVDRVLPPLEKRAAPDVHAEVPPTRPDSGNTAVIAVPSSTAPTGATIVAAPASLPAPVVHASRPVRDIPATDGARRSSLADENALLREAAAALQRGRMQQALELTDAHAQRFARSAFADLRAAIRIEALCGLGKSAQARGEATVFLGRHPDSPAVVRIENSCAKPPQTTAEPDIAGT